MGEMVSVIIPTYNRAQLIKRAVVSVLKQTYRDFELIIVDDGSQDETEEIIDKIIKETQGDRIRYIKLDRNQGVSHARNVGIQEAKYEYIAFLDSDDEWMPLKIELQMQKMLNADKEVALVFCRMGGKKRDSEERYVCPPENVPKEILVGNLFSGLLQQNVIGTPTMLVRKECLKQVGGFKESLRCIEDWEMILRLARKWKIEFVDEQLVEVYKTEGSISVNTGAFLVTRCYMISLYRKEMEQFGILEKIKEDILALARECGLYEETIELLSSNIRL